MARSGKTMIDLLEACRRSKFLAFSLDNAIIRDLKLTAVGQLLSSNLNMEWIQAGSNSSSVPIFFGRNNLSLEENISHVKEQNKIMKLPFGITVEQSLTSKRVAIGGAFVMELPESRELCTSYLLPKSSANQFIYQLQRQRKIWWMRLSVDPGRYFISDLRRNEGTNPTTSVSVCARFLDRTDNKTEVELERIECTLNENISEFAETSIANVCLSNNLNRATLAILMDALDAAPMEQCVKINRKIAPFKCGIICQMEDQQYAQDTGMQQELSELSKHLTFILRAAKLSVQDYSFHQLQTKHQFAQLDQIGVPYVLLINAQTLHTGLLQLRSRDTTLSETIHLTDLPHYLSKIINA